VRALLLLVSPSGDWINGQGLLIDGGWSSRSNSTELEAKVAVIASAC
jgi:hypothetical protein